MNALCRIELLGSLRIRRSSQTITRFPTYKTGALLAYLAYYGLTSHPREVLIELLWPDVAPEAGRQSLSQALSSLRHQLEPPGVPAGSILVADRATVQLHSDSITLDVTEWKETLRLTESPSAPLEALKEAARRYTGPLLPGYYEDWILQERDILNEAYLHVVQRAVAGLEREEDLAGALEYARQAVCIDPLREAFQATLIRLYREAGEAAAALRQYRRFAQLLERELGVAPDPAIRALVHDPAIQTPRSRPLAPERTTASSNKELPAGTVTLLLAQAEAEEGRNAPLRNILRRQGGQALQEGEGRFLIVFGRASDAYAGATAGMRTLSGRLRMALHTGEIGPGRAGALSLSLLRDRAAGLLQASRNRQILCTEVTTILLRQSREASVRLVELGLFRLQGEEAAERLFAVDYPDRPLEALLRPEAEAGHTGSLPLPITRFFGREREIASLMAELRKNTRLLTLTGPGGIGKTRLALETARRLQEVFHGAVWFVPLAELTDLGGVPDAVFAALDLSPAPGKEPLQAVIEALSRQPSLLILDNFEQLLPPDQEEVSEASAGPVTDGTRRSDLVADLLAQTPTLTCLVTSRQALRLTGEHEFPVTPLPTPHSAETPERVADSESVALFVDRAQAVRPDFQVTKRNAAALAGLCERLEGIPLALELAAARAQVMTPAQMLAQMERRFDFLVSRKRDQSYRR